MRITRKAIALLLMVLVAATPAVFSQNQTPQGHQHHAPALIEGVDHPEQIPDEHAWLLQLVASTSADKDKPETKKHAQVHRDNMGLKDSESTLTAFRQSYEKLVADEAAATTGEMERLLAPSRNPSPSGHPSIHVGSDATQLIQQRFNHDLYVLVVNTVGRLETDYAPDQWQSIADRVQQSKSRMVLTDEKPVEAASNGKPHFQLASLTINDSGSICGYDAYVALDTDGTTDYVSTYVTGSTNISWSCNYVYTGPVGGWQWEPAGCPAQHTVYITNQVDGVGPNNVYYGTYSPTTFVNLSATQAFNNDGLIHIIINGGLIACSVVGYFLNKFWNNNVKHGSSVFQWSRPPTEHYSCSAQNTCTNSPPFIVDGNKVYWSNYTCPVAWICHSFCVKRPTGVWTCPGDNPGAGISAS